MNDEYIRREEVIDKIRSLKSRFRAKNDWDSGYDTAIAEAFEYIKRVKVADVQAVIYAHWIELPKALNPNENPYKCSNCGHILSFMNGYPKSKYCDTCGAKMEQEE